MGISASIGMHTHSNYARPWAAVMYVAIRVEPGPASFARIGTAFTLQPHAPQSQRRGPSARAAHHTKRPRAPLRLEASLVVAGLQPAARPEVQPDALPRLPGRAAEPLRLRAATTSWTLGLVGTRARFVRRAVAQLPRVSGAAGAH